MPRAMWCPQSVTVDTVVYIADRGGVILRYDPHNNQWTELPEYQYCYFTITELTHQLVVVGGEVCSLARRSRLYLSTVHQRGAGNIPTLQ